VSCVLTLKLDPAAQECFERLRRTWFPAELNQIPAHLTLFHTLPEGDETCAALQRCAADVAEFEVGSPELRSIGRGVAYFFASDEAKALHAVLRGAFAEHVSAQDRQGFRPHVVVQNKVTAERARETLAALEGEALPSSVRAVGIDLWRYLGGPWQHLQTFPFGS
jgi:2'-5' RNA ligase